MEILIFLGVLIGLPLIGVLVAVVVRGELRRRRINALTSRGWTFLDDPNLWEVAMLHRPPFGRQFKRSVDDLVRGRTPDGHWFQAFDYTSTEFTNRVLTVRLPRALPELYVLAGTRPRPGVEARPLDGYPFLVCCDDPDYARALLRPEVLQAIVAYGRLHPLDLAVDGNHLTAVGATSDADLLAGSTAALAGVAAAIDRTVYDRYGLPDPERGYTFHGRPDWTYVGVNNQLLQTVQVSTQGSRHRTAEVVTSTNNGLPFVAFEHHWVTTSTSTDGQGNTRTTTHHHVEYLMEFALPFRSPPLTISYDHQRLIRGWGNGLAEINLEHQQFNDLFDIRCVSTKFAYDILHPRQMEYLARCQPPPFVWGDGRAGFKLAAHNQDTIAWICDFFDGFIRRVPSFVWKDLQAPPPLRLIER